jgi:hypothetical protein
MPWKKARTTDWFTLQHYDRFDGKYPPPIAQADIEIPVSGTF